MTQIPLMKPKEFRKILEELDLDDTEIEKSMKRYTKEYEKNMEKMNKWLYNQEDP